MRVYVSCQGGLCIQTSALSFRITKIYTLEDFLLCKSSVAVTPVLLITNDGWFNCFHRITIVMIESWCHSTGLRKSIPVAFGYFVNMILYIGYSKYLDTYDNEYSHSETLWIVNVDRICLICNFLSNHRVFFFVWSFWSWILNSWTCVTVAFKPHTLQWKEYFLPKVNTAKKYIKKTWLYLKPQPRLFCFNNRISIFTLCFVSYVVLQTCVI